ncbi:PP2C family protein-serine/threonine phosphatase [Alienimonas californiensis]|uniref:Serine/threonine phosphatase stp n=1 Tax=Alienimonas californiensis TaxID=2527989 RepID=A0A517PDT1_9PLAN|nr:protein phosphatase 2C domain-containing protein [Alienimonas californiensis]QDT17542.1 Serine/threonine phosphatase stp [Alienimonas californiensis]
MGRSASPKPIQLRHGVLSITGNFRKNNEDSAFVDPDGRFFVVADGMGGQAAGEKASAMAVEMIPEALVAKLDFKRAGKETVSALLDRAVAEANAEIMAAGALDPEQNQMGTTVVFLVAAGGLLHVGGVGDSRVYLLRDGQLRQLTTDHSLVQALVEAGTIKPEEAATHRYKNVLYRYLGSKEGGQGACVKALEPRRGDRFLLCSDGVTDGLDGDPLRELLRSQADPQAAAEAVVQAAQDGGSKDNITCLIVDVA